MHFSFFHPRKFFTYTEKGATLFWKEKCIFYLKISLAQEKLTWRGALGNKGTEYAERGEEKREGNVFRYMSLFYSDLQRPFPVQCNTIYFRGDSTPMRRYFELMGVEIGGAKHKEHRRELLLRAHVYIKINLL